MKFYIRCSVMLFLVIFNVAKAASIFSPTQIKVANNQQSQVNLSDTDINRIFVQNDKIVSVNAPNNRLTAHNDISGSIYMTVFGKTPFTAFINTENGRHFSLLVVPKSEPGVTIQFIPTTPLDFHYQKRSEEATKYESSSPYESTLVNLLRDVMLNGVPPGYSEIPANSLNKIAVFRVPSALKNQTVLDAKMVAGLMGGDLDIRVIQVTNHAGKLITLLASDFYQSGVRAVAISNENLQPNESSDIYEVVSND